MSVRTLDLSGCSEQLVDVSPLSSLICLNVLYLDFTGNGSDRHVQLAVVSPLSVLVELETLHLAGCKNIIDVSPLSTLTSLHDQLVLAAFVSAARCFTTLIPHLLDQLGYGLFTYFGSLLYYQHKPAVASSAKGRVTYVVSHLFDQLKPVLVYSAKRCIITVVPLFFEHLQPLWMYSAERCVITVVPHLFDQLGPAPLLPSERRVGLVIAPTTYNPKIRPPSIIFVAFATSSYLSR